MKMNNNNCHGCTRRHVGCHAECPDYTQPTDRKKVVDEAYIYDVMKARRIKQEYMKKHK